MTDGEVLWKPPLDGTTAIERLMAERGFDPADYDGLWRWSVDDLEGFWAAVWSRCGVRASLPYERVLSSEDMPGARWFEGARLSYAEHALARQGDGAAVVGVSQTRGRVELSWDGLRDQVARCRAGLQRLGVGPGDRVAAYLPNIPETVVAFLAAASLGAVWTSCAPEFGVQAVLDRLAQVEPKVLLVVEGYRYGARDIDRRAEVAAITAGLPSVEHVVRVPYRHQADGPGDWAALLAESGPLEFEQVAPDHPLYVLYSSGTTGLPKGIVHGTGGILLEHLKVLTLHADLGPSDRFAWFTTTGWMMWNYLVSGLLVGATIVLFDGDPGWPDLTTLWRLCADERLTWFGASAPFIMNCRKAGLSPGSSFDLSELRAVGSTGAPLPADGFRWVYTDVSKSVLLSSISGGTDVCSAFVGGCPVVPVRAGEISCRYLGCAVESWDGELVITKPMPSMPVGFWNDPGGERYRAAYFEAHPGVWTHGDWVEFTEHGGLRITGRSDATLNRGGVRMGTSEIYRVVESVPGVTDSLVVHLEDEDVLVLFVVAEGDPADAVRTALRTQLSPRHAPDEVHVVAAIPTTLSGKKLEIPAKRILAGADPATVASRDALKDPAALDAIAAVARTRSRPRAPS
jgi:acetoacetyl-CoA synthetase